MTQFQKFIIEMKNLLYVLFALAVAIWNCEAACKFGEITFKEENDAEDILKHYLQHKLSISNVCKYGSYSHT